MTGPDLAISVLAFHYALLAMSAKPPRFDTSHPRLLIVDEPEQQMMESIQYQRIMRQLVDLAHEYRDQIQVIVAATDIAGFEQHLLQISTSS